MKTATIYAAFGFIIFASPAFSQEKTKNTLAQSLWASQVISSVYHYDYQHYLADQKKIARYFSAKAWIDYTKANLSVKLPQLVQQNQWTVRSVPIAPPTIKALPQAHWQANMPVMVAYKNAQQVQYQTMQVQVQFSTAPPDASGNQWRVVSFKATPLQPSCKCAVSQAKANINRLPS